MGPSSLGRKMPLKLLVLPLKMRAVYWLVRFQQHKQGTKKHLKESKDHRSRSHFSELLWGGPWGRSPLNQVFLHPAMSFSWYL